MTLKKLLTLFPALCLTACASLTAPAPSASLPAMVSVQPATSAPTLTSPAGAKNATASLQPTFTPTAPEPTPTAPAPTLTATNKGGTLTHTVQAGESLFRIAARYGVDLNTLRAVNGITGNAIYAGQVLIIPPASVSPAPAVSTECAYTWFFADNPPDDMLCPSSAPMQALAATERFEHGQMIWVKSKGLLYDPETFFIFFEQPQAFPTNLGVVERPLNFKPGASGDNRTGETPPPGLYEPVSDFGLIWRGEVVGTEGFRARLGWATEAEFGFTTLYQCEEDSGIYWNCYLRDANNQTLHLFYLWHFGYCWERY